MNMPETMIKIVDLVERELGVEAAAMTAAAFDVVTDGAVDFHRDEEPVPFMQRKPKETN